MLPNLNSRVLTVLRLAMQPMERVAMKPQIGMVPPPYHKCDRYASKIYEGEQPGRCPYPQDHAEDVDDCHDRQGKKHHQQPERRPPGAQQRGARVSALGEYGRRSESPDP